MASGSQTGMGTLRWMVAGSAVALVAVVAGFIAAGRLRLPNFRDLPHKMGIDVTSDSSGVTYDQSSKGKHLYTIHAAKEVQRTNGTIALHDVGIVLYGPKGEPADRIHGADFEYDQKKELLTAQGEVFIDLVPPPPQASAAKPLTQEEQDARLIHVKTVGLIFDQKGQLATTDGPVEFYTQGFTGNAVGATYDSDRGVVVLERAVRISGLRSGLRDQRPVVLTADHAVMNREPDRSASQIDLIRPRYVSASDAGSETAFSAHAIVDTAEDGTPRHISADGAVTLTSDQRGTVVSDRLELALGDKGQAQAAHLFGNVRYTEDDSLKRERGHAEDARIAFDAEGRPVHALFGGGVTFAEQGAASARNLDAPTVDATLSGGGKQPTIVRAAEAFGSGGATLKLVDEDEKARRSTAIRADRLIGQFAAGVRTTELTGLDGKGHSWVQRIEVDPAGKELSKDTSTGDTLHVDFKPGAKGRSELTRAEQRGAVTTEHEAARKPTEKAGPPEVDHGRADDAVYEAEKDLVHLVGAVELQDETSAVFADRVDVDRARGDSVAAGAVRVTYISPPVAGKPTPSAPAEPVHVLAARAVAHKASGFAEFFGNAKANARMWQGSSQVEAPVLEFYQKEKRLEAHGEPGSDVPAVRTVLANAGGSPVGSGTAKQANSGPVRILSREMVYTDSARTVVFTGAVRLVEQGGTMQATQATAWLAPAGTEPAGTGSATQSDSSMMAGKLDHIVATGAVQLDQPGRRATGEKLVYTASDGIYVLTGTKAAPPRVVDRAQGTTTGAVLKFRSGDDSVEVLGSEDGRSGRVRSETRMRQ
jgi:lipopolysaccharide export system protein LptA